MGHTPVDTIFTLYGLAGAGQVLDFLFTQPVIALVFIIAVVGTFMTLARAIMAESSAPLLVFGLVNISTFIFFSMTMSISSNQALSWAEQAGARIDQSVVAGLKRIPGEVEPTSLGLVLMVRAISGVMHGMTQLVNKDFIAAPMAVTRAIALGMIVDIRDPALRTQADDFMRECYAPALELYVSALRARGELQEDQLKPELTWPGADRITNYYHVVNNGFTTSTGERIPSCNDRWTQLVDQLKRSGGEYERIQKTFNAGELYGNVSESDYLRLIFSNYLRNHTMRRDNVAQTIAKTVGELPNAVIAGVGTIVSLFDVWPKAVQIIVHGPYVQGAIMGVLLFFFPVLMLALLIPGGGKLVLNYFLVITWLRAWSVVWALADQIVVVIAASMFAREQAFVEAVADSLGAVSLVSSLLYIGGPIVLYIVIGGGAAALSSLLGFSGIGLPFVMNIGRMIGGALK
jgi:hypothetical protein